MALAVDVDGTWLNPDSIELDGGELRRADGAMFAGGMLIGAAAGHDVLGGVVRHSDTALDVTVDGGDNIAVKAGEVVIPGNAAVGTGPYRCGIESDVAGSLNARHATNPRKDLLVFRQLDTDVVPAHGAYKGQLVLLTGNPAPAPVIPTFPTMAVELARFNVPPLGGGAATVDKTFRSYACGLGGELIVPAEARLPESAAKYQLARALDTGMTYRFMGAGVGWAIESYSFTDSFGAAETTTSGAWTDEINAVTLVVPGPASGRVRIDASVYIGSLDAADTGNHLWGIKISGALARNPIDNSETVQVSRGTVGRFGVSYVIDGLTPNAVYIFNSAYKTVGTVSNAYRAQRRLTASSA